MTPRRYSAENMHGPQPTPESRHEPLGVLRFFSNPAVGIAGSLASIISLVLAVFFYFQSQHYRELTFTMLSPPTTIVQAGQASSLRVEFRGREIKSDVVAVQMLLWNRGRSSIRPEHVLTPVEITVASPASILEAKIVKQSREIVGASLSQDRSLLEKGRLPFSFKILERDDGAIVQVIFEGPREAKLNVTGTVEGQTAPYEFGFDFGPRKTTGSKAIWLALIVAGASAVTVFGYVAISRSYRGRPLIQVISLLSVFASMFAGIVVGLLLSPIALLFRRLPPFAGP